MRKALLVTGVIVVIIGLIAGITSGSFIGFLAALLGCITSAIIFFALSTILENQEIILDSLYRFESNQRNSKAQVKITCSKCKNEYDIDRSSCPHCGNRQ